ncbi:hypothetical protein V5O48_005521 [Marasmius crinis-equi]|uniref:Uncharacterized protein n=1 Tax=Marasmius crinis-equi TaxID=585013 RepID=A0ABR3FM13_9AGAR
MRFSILKKWSTIIHRRGRSDSHIHFLQSNTTQVDYPHSISAGDINTRQLDIHSISNPTSSPLLSSEAPPKTISRRSASNSESAKTIESSNAKSTSHEPTKQSVGVVQKLASTKKRISQLKGEREVLEASSRDLNASARSQQRRLDEAKRDLHSTRASCTAEKKRQSDIESEVQRDIQRQMFANALLELGNAHKDGLGLFLDASEEEVVDAIQKAAEREGDIWCTILSDIVGPLAPDNYISAINIALDTKKELRSVRKIARFWKRTANLSDVVTPSASNMSDVQEPLSAERRRAVENLQRQRRSSSVQFSTPTLFAPSASIASQRSVALPYLSSTHSISTHRHESLGPLASQVFKEELINAHSSFRMFSSPSSRILRTKSEPVDENRSMKSEGLSQKALGKQREITSQTSHPPSGVRSSLSPPALPNLELPSPITNVLLSEPKEENTFLQAERALHSFERICNSFPSSNFGSLQAISEEISQASDYQDGPDTTLVNATRTESDAISVSSLLEGDNSLDATFVHIGLEGEEKVEKAEKNLQSSGAADIHFTNAGHAKILLPVSYSSPACSPEKSHERKTLTKPPRPTSISFVLPNTEVPGFKPVAPLNIVKKNKRASLSLF